MTFSHIATYGYIRIDVSYRRILRIHRGNISLIIHENPHEIVEIILKGQTKWIVVNVKPSMSLKSIFLTYSLLLSSQLDFFTFFQTKILRSIAGKRKISKMLFFVCFFFRTGVFLQKVNGSDSRVFRELLACRGQGQCDQPNANKQNHLLDYNRSITIISRLYPTTHYWKYAHVLKITLFFERFFLCIIQFKVWSKMLIHLN